MPTTPSVKKVRATPNDKKDSWSIKLEKSAERRAPSSSLVLFAKPQNLACGISNDGANDTRENDLV